MAIRRMTTTTASATSPISTAPSPLGPRDGGSQLPPTGKQGDRVTRRQNTLCVVTNLPQRVTESSRRIISKLVTIADALQN